MDGLAANPPSFFKFFLTKYSEKQIIQSSRSVSTQIMDGLAANPPSFFKFFLTKYSEKQIKFHDLNKIHLHSHV
ncbi:hypothetical protein ACJIZ3_021427 [Penstemon smallii]|uniref:Uncharacterized protein n=1 Tax=Penstemon smallii TaxID=265156 RepID=A0ABD3SLI7_9LAMI